MYDDHKVFNKSEEHEVNYRLRVNDLRQNQSNRDTLIDLLEPSKVYTHEEVDRIVKNNISKFEKA